jgi:hypothetical protein
MFRLAIWTRERNAVEESEPDPGLMLEAKGRGGHTVTGQSNEVLLYVG